MKLFTTSLLLAAMPLIGITAPAALAQTAEQTVPVIKIAYVRYATLVSRDSSSPINVRDGASTRAYARHIGYAGDRVEVLDRATGSDGYMWYCVRFTVSNAIGWIRGDFISLDGE